MSTIGIAGRYRIEAENSKGERRVLADWFNNLILNNGLDLLGQATTPFARCVVGSGNTAAAATQVQLSNFVASTTTQQAIASGNNSGGGFTWVRITYRFGQGVAQGNLSEVGVGETNTSLFSRALIVDGSGTPTTITVLADEFLDVLYEFRLYWPTTDATGSVSLDGVTYGFTLRANDVGSWSNMGVLPSSSFRVPYGSGTSAAYNGGTLGTITQPLQGVGGTLGSVSNGNFATYSTGTYQLTFAVTFGLTAVTSSFDKLLIQFTFLGSWKMEFSQPIPKTDQNMIALNFTLSWARRSI